jgi:hypothetical protein
MGIAAELMEGNKMNADTVLKMRDGSRIYILRFNPAYSVAIPGSMERDIRFDPLMWCVKNRHHETVVCASVEQAMIIAQQWAAE